MMLLNRRFMPWLLLLATLALSTCWSLPAQADWDPGDGHKMHYPQLPDPEGWDVRVSNSRRAPNDPFQWIIADDWQCSETGPVSDVHFWFSWSQDVVDQIVNVHLSIHDNIPAEENPDGWSIPGNLLWSDDFGPPQFSIRPYGEGDQGWYDPVFGDFTPEGDHLAFSQINIVDILDPFEQQQGEIYWLDVSVDLQGESETGQLGWKTSQDHFMDDAVYWNIEDEKWIELRDPVTQESLDMAFVITIAEPHAGLLLAIGALGLLALRRR